jgi:hypothetical protein
MRALSIRQPYAEQILRGTKTVEYRSRRTNIIGEEFYIYAATTPGPPHEFALLDCAPGDLPTGVLVGTARIWRVTRDNGHYHWHLTAVKRLTRHRKPRNQPQPAWFRPF